jgi:putative nucleotidyltransferase with HDIG domain
MHQMMQHLIVERGFRKFVFMQGFDDDPDSKVRYEIFRNSLSEHGILFRSDFLLSGHYFMTNAYNEMLRFMSQTQDFEVVVCANDHMAFGVIEALYEVGKNIPDDYAVVGFDDLVNAGHTSVPMTTVRQPLPELGKEAARLLLKQINGQPVPQTILLPTQLVVRQSCGSPAYWQHELIPAKLEVIKERIETIIPPEIEFPNNWTDSLLLLFNNSILYQKNEQHFLQFWRKWVQFSATRTLKLSWWQTILSSLHSLMVTIVHLETLQRLSQMLIQAQQIVLESHQLALISQNLQFQNRLANQNVLEIAMMTNTNLPKFNQILKQYIEIMGFNRCFIALYDERKKTSDLMAYLVLAHHKNKNLPLDDSMFQAKNLLPKSMDELLTGNLMLFPLFTAETHYGFMLLETATDEYQQAENLSQSISRVLHHVIHIKRLEASYEGAIRAIGLALEARDEETAGHTDRVTSLATKLGTVLNLSEQEIRNLRWGAYLHDIGKMVIADAILHKPSALSQEERQIMMAHSTIGQQFAERLPFLPVGVSKIIRHHHERWDGNGYPDGLSGEKIDLNARIFAICDVCDALLSHRPYKIAFGFEQTVRELQESAKNGHLDPNLVEIFINQVLPDYRNSLLSNISNQAIQETLTEL